MKLLKDHICVLLFPFCFQIFLKHGVKLTHCVWLTAHQRYQTVYQYNKLTPYTQSTELIESWLLPWRFSNRYLLHSLLYCILVKQTGKYIFLISFKKMQSRRLISSPVQPSYLTNNLRKQSPDTEKMYQLCSVLLSVYRKDRPNTFCLPCRVAGKPTAISTAGATTWWVFSTVVLMLLVWAATSEVVHITSLVSDFWIATHIFDLLSDSYRYLYSIYE